MTRTKELNPAIAVNGGIASPDPWNYGSLVSQVAATGSVLFTGTETDADVLHLTFTSSQLPAGSYELSLTTSGSESLTAIATAFKNLINNDPLLSSLGITATSSSATVSITWIGGPLGNFATITFTKSGGATEGATVTQFSGGAGYVTPQQDYTMSFHGSVIKLFYGKPIEVDYLLLQAMINAGISIK
jgi:hypothetical protein